MVAGASALALLIFMFFPWYGLSAEVPGAGDVSGANANAWEAFSFIDILLFLVILIAIGLVAARAAGSMPAGLPAPPGMIVAAAGALAVLLILFRLISTPGGDAEGFGVEVDIGRKIGAFLGLLAAGGIAFGGWTAMNERASGQAPGSSGAGRSAGADGPGGSGPGGGGTGGTGPGPGAAPPSDPTPPPPAAPPT
jgi:hypothetical protein